MNKKEAFVKGILIGFKTENAAFQKLGMVKNGAGVSLRALANMLYRKWIVLRDRANTKD